MYDLSDGFSASAWTATTWPPITSAYWTLSLAAFHWRGLEGLLKGDARAIAEDGHMHDDRLAEDHMTKNDFRQELRRQGGRLELVSKATLARNGRLGIRKVRQR